MVSSPGLQSLCGSMTLTEMSCCTGELSGALAVTVTGRTPGVALLGNVTSTSNLLGAVCGSRSAGPGVDVGWALAMATVYVIPFTGLSPALLASQETRSR